MQGLGSDARFLLKGQKMEELKSNSVESEIGGNKVKVTVRQLTPWSLALDAARSTMGRLGKGTDPKPEWKENLLHAEHSVIRRVRYEIVMEGIPSWVSVHYVRHKYGVEHFVQSQRDDRNPNRQQSRAEIGQGVPVLHTMDINLQELLFIARRRLCGQASKETRQVMQLIKQAVEHIDPQVAGFMVPMCIYRGGTCHEMTSCGVSKGWNNE